MTTKIDMSKLNYKMGKRYKLVPLLEKAIVNHAEDEWQFTYQEKLRDHHWHPSGHCLLPPSQLFLIATDAPREYEPISNSLRKTYQVGHYWHQWLQYLCVTADICRRDDVERHEVWKYGEGPYESVSGSADICPLRLGEWYGGVDFKTMNQEQYEKPEFSEYFGQKYECQMNIYMHLFDVDNWLIFCINKNNGEFKEYEYIRNQPLIDVILDKFEFVSEAVRNGDVITTLDDEDWLDLPFIGPVLS